jgi:preprotein translocase subunit YajC
MEKIFVSIASYRDKNCSNTVSSLYKNAKHPKRVFCGICEQNKNKNEKCIDIMFGYKQNVRTIEKNYTDAKGPTYARYLCSTLYDGEDFFLQIDSHSLFVKDWDEICIAMIKQLESSKENKKVILSHYPPAYESYTERPTNNHVTHLVDCFFNNDGILTFHGAKWKPPLAEPRRNAFLAGGFIFCRGSWVIDVPFDPDLDFLFTGEEILLSVRSYTSGYDVYTPNKNIVFHMYTRKNDPKFWTDNTRYSNHEVKEKVKIISGLDGDIKKLSTTRIINSLKKYNIGKERTLKDFYDFIGVDPKTKTIGKPKVEFYQQPTMVNIGTTLIVILFFVLCYVLVYRSGEYRKGQKNNPRKNRL